MPRLTKIIATLGPSSADEPTIRALVEAGVNVFRLNFSHAEATLWAQAIDHIKAVRKTWPHPIAILGDLQGPKIRVGTFANEQKAIMLSPGQLIEFAYSTEPGHDQCINTPLKCLLDVIQPGQPVLLNDGMLEMEVMSRIDEVRVTCKVIKGGLLKEKKGINTPNLRIDVPPLTDKDKQDCEFALRHGVDYLALSFVQNHRDVLYLKSHLSELQARLDGPPLPAIIAKIETPLALEDIDAILTVSDGIMVARGDLGVELNPERVPVVQKWLIGKANDAEKPVITATQMLESMIEAPVPTRAEVSDVANAVFDGSDALMLSGETAMGKYPIEVVEMMAKIMTEAEKSLLEIPHQATDAFLHHATETSMMFHQAIAHAAPIVASRSSVDAIAVLSFSGSMAIRIAKQKPKMPVIALTPSITVYQKLALLWSLFPLLVEPDANTDEMIRRSLAVITDQGMVKPGDDIVYCAGKTHLPGLTNTLKILTLPPA